MICRLQNIKRNSQQNKRQQKQQENMKKQLMMPIELTQHVKRGRHYQNMPDVGSSCHNVGDTSKMWGTAIRTWEVGAT